MVKLLQNLLKVDMKLYTHQTDCSLAVESSMDKHIKVHTYIYIYIYVGVPSWWQWWLQSLYVNFNLTAGYFVVKREIKYKVINR